MKRFTSILKGSSEKASANIDTPEANIARSVRLFCESGGSNDAGEEVLHLPSIVENAESSPSAAREAANVIRKYLGPDNYQRAYVQYNSLMLVRILADNPGPSFTKNLDAKFTATVKALLRDGRDMSVQQILRETLDFLQIEKSLDEGLKTLITMWQNEKAKYAKMGYGAAGPPAQVPFPNVQDTHYRSRRRHGSHHRSLPPPDELASRIEEAKTSAKLLTQVVQSTPAVEVPGNDLIKEFVDRCQSASRSVQSYINAENPAPDEDTLLTLIETNDQLSMALSKHQRAILQARRANGTVSPATATGGVQPPPGPPPPRQQQQQQQPSQQHSLRQGPLQQPPPQQQQQQLQQPQRQPNPSTIPPPIPSHKPMSSTTVTNASTTQGPSDLSEVAPPGPPPQLSAPRKPSRAGNGGALAAAGAGNEGEDPFADNSNLVSPLLDGTNGTTTSTFGSNGTPSYQQQQQQQQQSPPQHPGYQATVSYVKRQDSSFAHHTMSGASANNASVTAAAAVDDDDEDSSPQQTRRYRF